MSANEKLSDLLQQLDAKLAEASLNAGTDPISEARHWEALGAARYLLDQAISTSQRKKAA